MQETETKDDLIKTVREVAELLVEKKANNVLVLDISSLTPMADCFIIADVEVQQQIDSLRSYVVDLLSARGIQAKNSVNSVQQGWALLDYNGFVVHLFLAELREYFGLEKIWGEGKPIFP